jgi:hypothetical protein
MNYAERISHIKKSIDLVSEQSKSIKEMCSALSDLNVYFYPAFINEKNKSFTGGFFSFMGEDMPAGKLGKNYSVSKIMAAIGSSLSLSDSDFCFVEGIFASRLITKQSESLGFPVRYGVSMSHLVTISGIDMNVDYETDFCMSNRYTLLTTSDSPQFVKIKCIKVPDSNFEMRLQYDGQLNKKPSRVVIHSDNGEPAFSGDHCFSRAIREESAQIKSLLSKYLRLDFESEILISMKGKYDLNGNIAESDICNSKLEGLDCCQAIVFLGNQ